MFLKSSIIFIVTWVYKGCVVNFVVFLADFCITFVELLTLSCVIST